jgi:hypothetical protein
MVLWVFTSEFGKDQSHQNGSEHTKLTAVVFKIKFLWRNYEMGYDVWYYYVCMGCKFLWRNMKWGMMYSIIMSVWGVMVLPILHVCLQAQ